VGNYSENDIAWVYEEFLMTNWWEGYTWDGEIPTGRNASFVPSNVSTYPFVCAPPSNVMNTIFGDEIKAHDNYMGLQGRRSGTIEMSLFVLMFVTHRDEFDDGERNSAYYDQL